MGRSRKVGNESSSEADRIRFQARLLDAVDQAVMATDIDGTIIYWNRFAEKLYGWSADEVLDRNVLDVTPPPANRELASEIMERLRAGESWSGEFELRRKDGSTFVGVVTDSPILDETGRLTGIVGVSSDVTAQKRAESELRESRERLERLMETLTDGVTFVDASGRITYANAAAERILGLTRSRIQELAYDDSEWRITAPDGGPFPAEQLPFARVMRTGAPAYGIEHAIEHPNGRRVVLSINAAPLFDADGQLIGMVSSLRDVTAQKASEGERARLLEQQRAARADAERRAEEEAALREAVAAVTAAVSGEEAIRQIARGAHQSTNAEFAVVERMEPDRDAIRVVAVAGAYALPLGGAIPFAGSLAERAIRRREAITVDDLSTSPVAPPHLRNACPHCTAAILPMVDGMGVVGALILLRDRGQQPFGSDEIERARTFANLALLAFRKVEMLEASENQRRELERVMESRTRLVRGFSHDVKNPLGAADGYAQILEAGVHGSLEPPQREAVARIRGALHAALELIDRTVELARAESGQLEVERKPIDAAALAREVAAEYEAQAHAARLELGLRTADGLPVVRSDPGLVRQVLGNLLSNALKYTPAGGRVTISVAPSSDGDAPRVGEWIAIAVSDTGPGVPEELRDTIFEEFVRGPANDRPGAGLGLAIGARIARALGGELTLRTRIGEGSTFTLWLPA